MGNTDNYDFLNLRGQQIYKAVKAELIANGTYLGSNDYQIAMYADSVVQFEIASKQLADPKLHTGLIFKWQRVNNTAKGEAIKIARFLGFDQSKSTSAPAHEPETPDPLKDLGSGKPPM